VDGLAEKYPDKLAMLHISKDKTERGFTFGDFKRASAQCANYFASLGIQRGDRVLLVLKSHYQFWFALWGFISSAPSHSRDVSAAGARLRLSLREGGHQRDHLHSDEDAAERPTVRRQATRQLTKILVGGKREGWHDFDSEYPRFSAASREKRTALRRRMCSCSLRAERRDKPKLAAHTLNTRWGTTLPPNTGSAGSNGLHLTFRIRAGQRRCGETLWAVAQ
jgi:acetyl-CoA synthetase